MRSVGNALAKDGLELVGQQNNSAGNSPPKYAEALGERRALHWLSNGKFLPLKVLIAEDIGHTGIRSIESLGESFVSVKDLGGKGKDALEKELKSADVFVVRGNVKVNANLIEKSPRLGLVIRAGNGLDNIDCEYATKRSIQVINTPSANINSTAEHAIGLIFSVARKISRCDRSIKNGVWDRHDATGFELAGKTVGIFGTGKIGSAVGEKCRALGMTVIGASRAGQSNAIFGPFSKLVSKREVLEQSDVISLHLPLNPGTRDFISKDELEIMKSEAILVNCARGGVVNEEALLDAIDSNGISGAAIDTFSQEPPVKDSAGDLLSRHINVVSTPHVGGQTQEALDRMGHEAAAIISRYIDARLC